MIKYCIYSEENGTNGSNESTYYEQVMDFSWNNGV